MEQTKTYWYCHDVELKFYIDNITKCTVDPEAVLDAMFVSEVIDDYCTEKDLVFFQLTEDHILGMCNRPSSLYELRSGLYMCSASDYFNKISTILYSATKWLVEYFETAEQ